MEANEKVYNIITESFALIDINGIYYTYVDYGTGLIFKNSPQILYHFTLN